MNSLRRSLLGMFLLSQLVLLSSGCGGEPAADDVSAPPDMNAPPDLSKMPGYNDMQENLKKKGQNP